MYFLLLNGAQAGPFSLEQLRTYWKEGHVNAETLFWQEGQQDWQPLAQIQKLITEANDSQTVRTIGGFWRRLSAWLVDSILLGLVGSILAMVCFQFLVLIGVWGLLIGLTISLLYFGLLNSALGRGQTLGKRLLGIEVVDREGRYISPVRSILRYLIFAMPFYLNGVLGHTSMAATSWKAMLLGTIIFIWGGAIGYLYLFNRRTRQSLHDLTVQTYVVRTLSRGPVQAPSIWRGHLIILGSLIVFLTGLISAGEVYFLSNTSFLQKLLVVQKAILALDDVQAAVVTEGVNWSNFNGKTETSHVLAVNVTWKDKPEDLDAAAKKVAAVVLKEYPEVSKDDTLSITISYGYNIGITWFSISESTPRSPQNWKELLEPNPPS